jgi:methylenetetrahydrofolate dehydrogenase (NADP+)/methenyltetrahydrofolate cyclohydrolase
MILDCQTIAETFDAEIQIAVKRLKDSGVVPKMCEILATQTQGTLSYSNTKKRKAAKFGIEYEAVQFGPEVHLNEVLENVNQLNSDDRVHGILIGMHTYLHIDSEKL